MGISEDISLFFIIVRLDLISVAPIQVSAPFQQLLQICAEASGAAESERMTRSYLLRESHQIQENRNASSH